MEENTSRICNPLQKCYPLRTKSRRTAELWYVELVNRLLSAIHETCLTRNEVAHKMGKDRIHPKESEEVVQDINRKYSHGPQGLLSVDHAPFDNDL